MTFPFMPNISGTRSLDTVWGISISGLNSASITTPSTVRNGDLMILFDGPSFSATTGITGPVPTGFTNISAGPSSGWTNGIIMSAKIATSSDASILLTGGNGTASNAKMLAVFRGNAPIRSFTVGSIASNATNLDPPGQIVSSAGVIGPAILACCGSSGTNVANAWQGYPSTYTYPAFNTYNSSIATRMVTGFSVVNKGQSPYDQRIDLQDYGSGMMMRGAWISLT